MNRDFYGEAIIAMMTVPMLAGLLFLLVHQGESPVPKVDVSTESVVAPTDFAQQLDARLRALSVRGYERLIAQLLSAAGYEQVRILRDHRVKRRSHKGRNGHGGVDITAVLRAEFGVASVLVQVKQYGRPVSRRFVDELRGALLRTEARQGLLITTSTFSPAARRAAQEDHIGPIRLIEGQELCELLVSYRLGIRRNKRGHLALRPRFFRRLDQLSSLPASDHAFEDNSRSG